MVKGQVRYYSAPVDVAIPASKRKYIPTSGTYPKGFVVSGTHVGVKASNTKFPDLALISSETLCSAAAVFTTNKFQAAPVQVSKKILNASQGQGIRSIVINSGCANAVTGKGGLEDAMNMAAKVDEYTGVAEAGTLVMSTGVIGQRYVHFSDSNIARLLTDSGYPSPKSFPKSLTPTHPSPQLTTPGSPLPAQSAQQIPSPNFSRELSPFPPLPAAPTASPE
jgi:hypothetical protein